MKRKNIAAMMLFWLVCQQAVAAVYSISSSDVAVPDGQTSTHESCHGEPAASDKHDAVTTHETNHEECCDIECQCCIGGCSMLPGQSPEMGTYYSGQLFEIVFLTPPYNPSSLLFRPPILA